MKISSYVDIFYKLANRNTEFRRGVSNTYERDLRAAVIYTLQDVVKGYTRKEITYERPWTLGKASHSTIQEECLTGLVSESFPQVSTEQAKVLRPMRLCLVKYLSENNRKTDGGNGLDNDLKIIRYLYWGL